MKPQRNRERTCPDSASSSDNSVSDVEAEGDTDTLACEAGVDEGCIDPEKTLEHSSLDLGISAQSSSIVLPFLQGLRQVYKGFVLKRKRWRRVYEPVLVLLNYHHLSDAVLVL